MDFTVDDRGNVHHLKLVAGVDFQAFRHSEYAVAVVTVLSYPGSKMLYHQCHIVQTKIPYIPGYLSFREAPSLVALVEGIPEQFKPQLILIAGHGAFHPRGCGIATQLGVACSIPTIGIAKTMLKVGGLTTTEADALAERYLWKPGRWVQMDWSNGRPNDVLARKNPGRLAVLLRPGQGNYVIVSPGLGEGLRSDSRTYALKIWKSISARPVHLVIWKPSWTEATERHSAESQKGWWIRLRVLLRWAALLPKFSVTRAENKEFLR